jgi:hypothetical protein
MQTELIRVIRSKKDKEGNMANTHSWTALRCTAVLLFAFTFQQLVRAQDASTAISADTSGATAAAAEPQTAIGNVPRLMKISGMITALDGKPATGAVSLTFTLYQEQEGMALWTETQSAQLDAQGHYTVLLGAGSTEGLPLDLFASGNALWLGVQPELSGATEQPRVLLVAVPYALKASDADTLGGKPASAYVLSQDRAISSSPLAATGYLEAASQSALEPRPGVQAGPSSATPSGGGIPPVVGIGTPNSIPLWTGKQTLGNSILFQAANNVGAGTNSPGARLDAVSTGIAVRGTSSGIYGNGVAGYAVAASGYNNGVYGQSASTTGNGLSGSATAASGYANGVYGQSASSSGSGLSGNATAVSGYTSGVYGQSVSTNGSGVYGSAPNGVGVGGMGATLGVWGDSASTTGSGVAGYADADSGNTNGVYGQSASTGGNGVSGNAIATTGNAYGVVGTTATTGFGAGVTGSAIATTGNAFGVFGQAASSSGEGVFGYASAASGGTAGVVGYVESPNAVAGQFVAHSGSGLILQGLSGSAGTQVFSVDASGNLDISGNLTVAGSKSARVKLQDGREVALYAVESPENWFEDFGTAQLQAGTAAVALDPGFLQTVDTAADYHVFLTPRGDCRGLYVARTMSGGFEVRELGGGSASIAFDYRIVAHRRGFENVRLQDVHLPPTPKEMQVRPASMRSVQRTVAPQPPRVAIPVLPQLSGEAH